MLSRLHLPQADLMLLCSIGGGIAPHAVIDLIIPEVASPKILPGPAYRFHPMVKLA
jgi:hypothetical protein